MTDKYAVIGNPIHHSKSPLIHKEFARQTNQDIEYSAIAVPMDELQPSLFQLRDVLKLKGINVTVPFKEQVLASLDDQSARAEQAGAINTIVFNENGTLYGDNTDGIGLCRDLTDNLQIPLTGKRILLIGAGGASRGVIAPLLTYQPSRLMIANRTADKAIALAARFNDFGEIDGGGLDAINDQFDLVINATSASLQGEVPPLPKNVLAEDGCCYDMMYGNQDTAFIKWAKNQQATITADGLGMLVEQAAESFYIWRGIRPVSQPVIALLRQPI